MTEIWAKWVGEVISGAFPLRRFLSGSDHSGVFLTRDNAQDIANAAIKIIPTDPAHTLVQLSQWRTAAALSHPHLIRLFDAGRCQLDGQQFLYVVMEYAEETLSQILPHRALTADEVRDMLRPTLDALAFLHGKNLVHGQLKPPNILVVDDQLKLASDTIRPAGAPRAGTDTPSPYDPPEAVNGRITAAGDIWALGITLVEALTQRPPVWPGKGSENVSLPAGLPPTVVEAIGRCLSSNPADRPTVLDLEGEFNLAPRALAVSSSQSVERRTTRETASPRKSPKQRFFVSMIIMLLVVLAAAWTGLRLMQRSPNARQPALRTGSSANSTESKPAPSRPASSPSDRPVRPLLDASPPVTHQEIPKVPRSASSTIHGRINVTVRVTVDSSGTVVSEILENPGPSKYFARLATTAAKQWKFAPADNRDAREWLLSFEFSRDGTAGHATSPQP